MNDVVDDLVLVGSVDLLDEVWDALPERLRERWARAAAAAFLRVVALGNRW